MAEGSLSRDPETMETGHPASGLQTVDDTSTERRHLLTQIDIPSFGAQLRPYVESAGGTFGETGTLQSQQPGLEGNAVGVVQMANSESGMPAERVQNASNGNLRPQGIPAGAEDRHAEQTAISAQRSLDAQEGQMVGSWRDKVTTEHRKTIVYNLVGFDAIFAALFCFLCEVDCVCIFVQFSSHICLMLFFIVVQCIER